MTADELTVAFQAEIDQALTDERAKLDAKLAAIVGKITWTDDVLDHPRLGEQLDRQVTPLVHKALSPLARKTLKPFTAAGGSALTYTVEQLIARCVHLAVIRLFAELHLERRMEAAEKANEEAVAAVQTFEGKKAATPKKLADQEQKLLNTASAANLRVRKTARYITEEQQRVAAAKGDTPAVAAPQPRRGLASPNIPAPSVTRTPGGERDIHGSPPPQRRPRPQRTKGKDANQFPGANFDSGTAESSDFPTAQEINK